MADKKAADRIAYYATLIKDIRGFIADLPIKANVSKAIKDIHNFERKIMELEQLN